MPDRVEEPCRKIVLRLDATFMARASSKKNFFLTQELYGWYERVQLGPKVCRSLGALRFGQQFISDAGARTGASARQVRQGSGHVWTVDPLHVGFLTLNSWRAP